MEVRGQLHAPAALLLGKSPPYSFDMKLDGPQSRYGRCGEGTNLVLTEIQTAAVQRVARHYTY
jgi:hypothetical protein